MIVARENGTSDVTDCCRGIVGFRQGNEGANMGAFMKTFGEMTKRDLQLAGGKAANLGELTQAGFNVPPGFCVTSESLGHHIALNGLQPRIDTIVSDFDYEDYAGMDARTAEIRSLISNAPIPEDLQNEMEQAIRNLVGIEQAFVAVRSSVAVKDSAISSFPGMMDTFHYLKGEEEIIDNIKKCWASLWTLRAAFNRHHKGIDHGLGLIAPIVQKMVDPEAAGILFTANPITGDRAEMVIESNWGLGESVVSGRSMNDFFLLSKPNLSMKRKQIATKTVMVCFDAEKGCGRKEMSVPQERSTAPTISDDQVLALGDIGRKIENLFGYPQDIEWSYEQGTLFILQSRNIRTLKDQKKM